MKNVTTESKYHSHLMTAFRYFRSDLHVKITYFISGFRREEFWELEVGFFRDHECRKLLSQNHCGGSEFNGRNF